MRMTHSDFEGNDLSDEKWSKGYGICSLKREVFLVSEDEESVCI